MNPNSPESIKLSSLEAQIVNNLRRIDHEKREHVLLFTRGLVQQLPARPTLRLVHSIR